jgi:hypothetical protein
MTSNEQYIKEFEDDFLTNPRRKIAYLNGDEKRELIGFLLNCFDKKDKEWKEEILNKLPDKQDERKRDNIKGSWLDNPRIQRAIGFNSCLDQVKNIIKNV